MFTDTHCHLYDVYYDNIEDIINESIKNNVTRFINNGCDDETNKEVIKGLEFYDLMYGAIGIHPENALKYNDKDLEYIEANLKNKKIVAIGEIGLDYHYTRDNKNEQIELLRRQLEIAEKHKLPVIVHSREATLDTINILKEYKVTGVIHSFSGSLETAKEYIKMGYLLGLNGVVTFKNSNLKKVVEELPLSSIVLETDSPYLTPEPFRGRQNNPSHIIDIAEFICELRNISLEELANITNNNIKTLFKI